MPRYLGPSCRLCRREGMKLMLKGDRCLSSKCALTKHKLPPGQLPKRRRKTSEYGVQLREKQKVKRIYGVLEKQFRGYYSRSERQKGITGTNLLVSLESRLDNIVYRMGFSNSRNQARQMVRHNHFLVNNKKVNIPSYLVRPGDVIDVKEKSRKVPQLLEGMETVVRRGIPDWIEVEKGKFRGTLKSLPNREDITMPIHEQLIVELYSK